MEKQYTDLKKQFSIYPPVGATLCWQVDRKWIIFITLGHFFLLLFSDILSAKYLIK